MSAALRPKDVCAVVGEIDANLLEQILATDATLAEIAEAVTEIEAQLGFDDRSSSQSPRVAKVRALLQPLFEQRDNISRGRD